MPTQAAVDHRRRVLLVTRNLPPVVGGMERLIGHVAGTLCRNFETTVVGPRGGRIEGQPRAYLSCPLSPPAAFLAAAAVITRSAARRAPPGLVFAGSGLTAPVARLAARRASAPYVVYLHGLDIAADHPVYRRVFVPAIRNADLVLANSRYTAARAVETGVLRARIALLHPGVTIPTSIPAKAEAARRFRTRFRLPPGAILFGAGRLTPRKGFADFVERSFPRILRDLPDAQLVVAGEVPRHAASKSGDEALAIRRAAEGSGTQSHVHLIGPLDDAALSLAWPAADVHVFPVRENARDPEGFGMVALEAAAWGVPTVAFAAGGIPDAVSDPGSGYLVPTGDYEGLAQAALRLLQHRGAVAETARAFAATFAWPRFDERLEASLAGIMRG